MNTSLFLALLTAHLLSDFTFQCESFCKNKTEKGFKGYALYVHALIVLSVTLVAIEPWSGLCGRVVFLCVAGIVVSHLLIDGLKSALERRIRNNKTLSIVESGPFYILTEKKALFLVVMQNHSQRNPFGYFLETKQFISVCLLPYLSSVITRFHGRECSSLII